MTLEMLIKPPNAARVLYSCGSPSIPLLENSFLPSLAILNFFGAQISQQRWEEWDCGVTEGASRVASLKFPCGFGWLQSRR